MPIFSYVAKATDGQVMKGQEEAATLVDLTNTLKARGLVLTKSQLLTKRNATGDFFERLLGVPSVQKIFFTQNLGVMLRGGFSISRAMGTLALQTTHKYFRKVIQQLQSDLESGSTFSQALKRHPHVFSELFINMIGAGEISGKLDDVLKALTIQMKKDHQLVSKVKGAMTYPVVVVVAMIGAGVAMMTLVIPKLLVVFEEAQTELPLPTRILIAMSDVIQHQGLLIAAGVVVLIVITVAFARTKKGTWFFDTIFLYSPIIGPIIKKINLARFTRNLSSMLATDIPIIQTFQVIGKTMSSAHYRRSIEEAGQALRGGVSIAKVLNRYPKLYPPLVQQMVNVGEESGTLDEVSGELAKFYEEEVDQTMSNLSTIIEPVLLLVLGAAVAGMAVSILLPMYSLSDTIN